MIDFSKYGLALLALGLIFTVIHSPSQQNLNRQLMSNGQDQFNTWVNNFGKMYKHETERIFRFNKFIQNYQFILNHNERYRKGQETYQVGLNQFADIDLKEFASLYLSNFTAPTKQCTGSVEILDQIPYDWDWSPRAVTRVENQGGCNAAWAFTASGAIEGLASLTKGVTFNFSTQQLVDCSSQQPYSNQGCTQGKVQNAYWYVIDNGITNETQYPYIGKVQPCKYTPAIKVFQNTKCAMVKPNKTRALESALVYQPVAVMVDSNQIGFQFYKKGVFSGACGNKVNHPMLLTGYGTLDDVDYWKCKNSWGLSWGQQGYIFMHRDKKQQNGPGQCGILVRPSVPLM